MFGIIVGPVLGLFDKSLFISLAPMMSVVALSIILFEAGINSDIIEIMQTMAKSTALSVSTILSVTVIVGLALNLLMPGSFSIIQGMLLGAMVSGTSTVAIFGILQGMTQGSEDTRSAKMMLTMESILSDPICIILSISFIRMIMLPGVSLKESVFDIFRTFILSSLLGFAIGIFWTNILDKIKKSSFTYMNTLSVLLPSYIFTERFVGEGGGAMTALAIGLAIKNYRYISDKLGWHQTLKVDSQKLREFHEEITFFIKSFFFVYIGVIVSLKLEYMVVGSILVSIIVVTRYEVVNILGRLLNMSMIEQVFAQFIFAAGLPSFIMAQLPLIYDPEGAIFPNPSIYADLCMPIVLCTVAFSAFIGSHMIKNRTGMKKNVN